MNVIKWKKIILISVAVLFSVMIAVSLANSEPSPAGYWDAIDGQYIPKGLPERVYLRNDNCGFVDWVEVRWYTEDSIITIIPQDDQYETIKFEYQMIDGNLYLYRNNEYVIYDK